MKLKHILGQPVWEPDTSLIPFKLLFVLRLELDHAHFSSIVAFFVSFEGSFHIYTIVGLPQSCQNPFQN